MNDEVVTYQVLPQVSHIDRQAMICFLKGHKYDITKDGKSLMCFDCGVAVQEEFL